jgi:DnaJ like chaperone protein
MSIWGKLIGGAAGMALGGPIGAILGIAAGHGVDKVSKFDIDESNKKFSNDQKEQIFATSVIAISAKLAKADGKISKSEILAFKKIFEFPAEDEKAISNIFNSAKENIDDYKGIAEQVYKVFKSDRGLLFELLNSLFSIAYADGELHPKEKVMLSEIAKIFQISDNEFESLKNIFEAKISQDNTSINRSYKILGLSENASLEQVSNQYRKLIKEYHPDKLQGMGLPKEFIELANQKLSAINKAYTEIKNNEKKSKL